ncbi:MAG TPA: PHB depolymerase family esterase [Longimicrobiaceae bacterium]|nr:PHB depolymerase family esterase [Longimicrobiaceae bacterium]
MRPSLRLLALLMSTPLAARAAPAQSADPADPGSRFTWESFAGEGGARRYRLYVPASHRRSRPAPLLVMLHGCTQDPDDFARGTRMNALAEEHGFLVAYPEQTAAHNPQRCWSWYDPAHQERGRGEPAAIAGIARQVVAACGVDPRRVYLAGVSAGGAMALNVAAAYPELFAAAGVHSGVAYRAAAGVPQALQVMQRGSADSVSLAGSAGAALRARGAPLPLLVIHGAADPVVRLINGEQLVRQWTGGLAAAAERRAEEGGLTTVRRGWNTGDGRAVVEEIVVEGLGHAWSGGSPEGTYTDPRGPDASREMVRFFLARAREER